MKNNLDLNISKCIKIDEFISGYLYQIIALISPEVIKYILEKLNFVFYFIKFLYELLK